MQGLMEITLTKNYLQVAIVSEDPMVGDCLQGILTFQGYHCSQTITFHQLIGHLSFEPGYSVVFLDMAYLIKKEQNDVQDCLDTLLNSGTSIILLVDGDWVLHWADFIPKGVNGILRKHLDYQQIELMMSEVVRNKEASLLEEVGSL